MIRFSEAVVSTDPQDLVREMMALQLQPLSLRHLGEEAISSVAKIISSSSRWHRDRLVIQVLPSLLPRVDDQSMIYLASRINHFFERRGNRFVNRVFDVLLQCTDGRTMVETIDEMERLPPSRWGDFIDDELGC